MVEAGLEIMKDVEDGQLITSLQMFFANPVILRADALLRSERIADATRDRLPREIDCFEPRPGVLMQGRQNQWNYVPFSERDRPVACSAMKRPYLDPNGAQRDHRNNNYCTTERSRKTLAGNFSRFNLAAVMQKWSLNAAIR